jgi:protein required for attachment to host cells
MTMSIPRIHRGDWIVVCDGTKALVLRNEGEPGRLKLKTHEVFKQADPKSSDLGADAPGRSFASVGSGRSAMEETDLHDQAEREFLAKLAGRLDAAAAKGDLPALILVAPPRALGVLRETYSGPLRKVLRGEVEKDYVNLPIAEIERRLAA